MIGVAVGVLVVILDVLNVDLAVFVPSVRNNGLLGADYCSCISKQWLQPVGDLLILGGGGVNLGHPLRLVVLLGDVWQVVKLVHLGDFNQYI